MGNKSSTDHKLCKEIKNNNPDRVRVLLANGGNPNGIGKDGLTHLQLSLMLNNEKIIEILLEHGADPNTVFGHNKMSPLHYAVQFRHQSIVRQLVNHNADVNLRDLNGNTPYDLAVYYGYLELIKYLEIKPSP